MTLVDLPTGSTDRVTTCVYGSTACTFAYDERWRILTTATDSDSDKKERFVYHAAGVDGKGDRAILMTWSNARRTSTRPGGHPPTGSLKSCILHVTVG